ncbi:MAG TPA: hypothetical protein VK390_15130, partial [Propionibacteriaceae bacterium]|nr:hypothetical protein [Propionibacteriaceae bacterium]
MDQEVVGAVKAVAPHPFNSDLVYVGTVNGGVWRTTNATSARPTWDQLTDAAPIGALEFDPIDPTHVTLVAGTGRFSSLLRAGGSLIGVLRTTDSGITWTTHNPGGLFTAFHICDVASRGNTIVVASNSVGGGIFRATSAGLPAEMWTQVSGAPGSGLPAGVSFALAGDPTLARFSHLYAHSGTNGIFKSTDTGGTWSKVSTAAMDALIATSANVKISVGVRENVYVA